MRKAFCKTLSANDVGDTGAHQAGILVPKSETQLLSFLPRLESAVKNPDAWINCIDESGTVRKFRFVYYNNRFHDQAGTRNEYRITHMTSYLKEMRAREGDVFEISRAVGEDRYAIRIVRAATVNHSGESSGQVTRIRITTAWRRIH